MTTTATSRGLRHPAGSGDDWRTQGEALRPARPSFQELADELRAEGHAVYARCAARCDTADRDLVIGGVEFLRTVLTTPRPSGRRSYVRLYLSVDALFIEVTQLAANSFDEATDAMSGHDLLGTVRRWAVAHEHMLSMRRGPRGQLRLALMMRRPATTST